MSIQNSSGTTNPMTSVSLENENHDFSVDVAGKFNSDSPNSEAPKTCSGCSGCSGWRTWGWMGWSCVIVFAVSTLCMFIGLFMGFAGDSYISTIGGILMIVAICIPAALLLFYGICALVLWGIEKYRSSREVTVI